MMKKPLMFCLVLLLALGITGVCYAEWSEVLKFNLSAETGTLKVGIRHTGSLDPDGDGPWYIRCTDRNYEFDLDGRGYYQSVAVEVYGGDSYTPGCVVEIANGGTVPATINQIKFQHYGNLALERWTVDLPDGYQNRGRGYASLRRTVRETPLDPGQKMRVEMRFKVKKEGDTGGRIDFGYRRWNVKH